MYQITILHLFTILHNIASSRLHIISVSKSNFSMDDDSTVNVFPDITTFPGEIITIHSYERIDNLYTWKLYNTWPAHCPVFRKFIFTEAWIEFDCPPFLILSLQSHPMGMYNLICDYSQSFCGNRMYHMSGPQLKTFFGFDTLECNKTTNTIRCKVPFCPYGYTLGYFCFAQLDFKINHRAYNAQLCKDYLKQIEWFDQDLSHIIQSYMPLQNLPTNVRLKVKRVHKNIINEYLNDDKSMHIKLPTYIRLPMWEVTGKELYFKSKRRCIQISIFTSRLALMFPLDIKRSTPFFKKIQLVFEPTSNISESITLTLTPADVVNHGSHHIISYIINKYEKHLVGYVNSDGIRRPDRRIIDCFLELEDDLPAYIAVQVWCIEKNAVIYSHGAMVKQRVT